MTNENSSPTNQSSNGVQRNDAQPTTGAYNSKEERGKAFRQIVAAFIANLGTINTGLVFGFSAVAIPQLKSAGSTIPINDSQASWIGKCLHMIFYYHIGRVALEIKKK